MEWVDCDDSLFRAYSLTNHPTHGDVFETFSVDAQASVVVQYFECPPNVTGAELENANIVLKLQNARCLPVNRIVWTDRRAVGAASETIYGFVVFYVDPKFPNPKQLSDEDVASYGRGNITAIYFETLAFFHNFGICQLQLTNRSFVVMGSSILFADATQVVLALCHGVQNGDGSLPAARKADLLNDATFRPPPELFAVDTSPQAQLAPSHTNEEAAVNTESHSSASHQTFLERKELALAGLLVGDTWALESRDVWSAATSLLICFARIFYSDQDGTRVHLFDIGPDGGATEYCNIVSKQPRDFEISEWFCTLPRAVRDLFCRLLSPDPSQRPTASQALVICNQFCWASSDTDRSAVASQVQLIEEPAVNVKAPSSNANVARAPTPVTKSPAVEGSPKQSAASTAKASKSRKSGCSDCVIC